MDNINDVYLFANMLANKQYSGAISPDEFNLCAPVGQLNHLRVRMGLPEMYQVAVRQAPQELEKSQMLDDVTMIFFKKATVAGNLGTYALPSDFLAYRPSFYWQIYIDAQGNAQKKRQPLDFLTSGEADIRDNNYVTPPSLDYPVISYENGTITVRPETIDQIDLRYVRYPAKPFRNFTPNTDDQDVYNPVGSVDFEFQKSEWEMITQRIVKYWATKFREEGLYQLADKAANSGS